MGARYQVIWSINNACPFTRSKWTNSLTVALMTYAKAVFCGNTGAVLVMHDWKNCPSDCQDFADCTSKVVG